MLIRLIVIVVCLLATTLCHADTLLVDDDGFVQFNTIQDAVDAASDGDLILVYPGTYTNSDDSGFRSGGTVGCPAGEIQDCNGNCCPDYWVGDGYCDDGQYSYNGIPIYLNCAALNYDNGDCDGGGGGSNADCDDPHYCSDCDGCEGSCCPNYCSGFYYYYNRTCDGNGFCIGATSDYCPDGCNDNGCL